MRKSRIEAAKTRERIVTAAAAEFRQHGIAATGLADLMKPPDSRTGASTGILHRRISLSPKPARPQSPR